MAYGSAELAQMVKYCLEHKAKYGKFPVLRAHAYTRASDDPTAVETALGWSPYSRADKAFWAQDNGHHYIFDADDAAAGHIPASLVGHPAIVSRSVRGNGYRVEVMLDAPDVAGHLNERMKPLRTALKHIQMGSSANLESLAMATDPTYAPAARMVDAAVMGAQESLRRAVVDADAAMKAAAANAAEKARLKAEREAFEAEKKASRSKK